MNSLTLSLAGVLARSAHICPLRPVQLSKLTYLLNSTHIYYLSRSQKMLPAKGILGIQHYPTVCSCQMLSDAIRCLHDLGCSYLCLLGGRIRQGLLCLNKFKQVHWHQLKIPIHSIHQIPFFTYLQPTPLFGSVGG